MSAATEPMTVVEAAEVFARAIRSSPAWQSWEQAQAAFDGDAAMRQAMKRLRDLSGRFHLARAQGKGLAGQEATEMAVLQGNVQGDPLYQAKEAEGRALVDFLRETNELLSKELGVDYAAAAAPRGGGCCG